MKKTKANKKQTSARDLLDALQTTSFAQWTKAIAKLRTHVDAGGEVTLTELDALMILRPYLWWRHNPGFADVIATCEAAMPVFMAHAKALGGDGKRVGMFIATFLDDGKHDGKSDEMETHVRAKEWATKLKGAEAKAMTALSELMHELYSQKHVAYNVLRRVGWQQIEAIGALIHGLPGADQAFILHALDGSLGQPGVKKFYKDFIANTPYPPLVAVAKRYALLD